MKRHLEIFDPFVELAKYERMYHSYSSSDIVLEAEASSQMENQKKLHDIKIILILTSRVFLLSSAVFGYCFLPIIYHFVFGWSVSLIRFLTVSGIIFPIYFYLIYDRLAIKPKNIRLREYLKQYRSILVKVIHAQKDQVSL